MDRGGLPRRCCTGHQTPIRSSRPIGVCNSSRLSAPCTCMRVRDCVSVYICTCDESARAETDIAAIVRIYIDTHNDCTARTSTRRRRSRGGKTGRDDIYAYKRIHLSIIATVCIQRVCVCVCV